MTTMTTTTDRFAASNHNGNEVAAYEALEAHRATLTIGARVRAYRGRQVEGTIVDLDGGCRVVVEESDGLRLIAESRNLELV